MAWSRAEVALPEGTDWIASWMLSGVKRETRTTEDTRQAIDKNLILFRASPNIKYAAIMMKTVFIAMSAPQMPPLSPAVIAELNEITDAYAPRNSRRPPMKM